MVVGREGEEEAVEVGHAARADADGGLEIRASEGRGLGDGMEVRREIVRADDGGGECGEKGCAEEKSEGESPASPKEKEQGDGEGELELHECEREDEAGEEGAAGFEEHEGEAVNKQQEDGELAHDEGEADGQE